MSTGILVTALIVALLGWLATAILLWAAWDNNIDLMSENEELLDELENVELFYAETDEVQNDPYISKSVAEKEPVQTDPYISKAGIVTNIVAEAIEDATARRNGQ
jgi:hypothetical protein